jgi:hypothetical protein
MSAETSIPRSRTEKTPGVGRSKTDISKPNTALRCGLGRYTVDFVADDAPGVATIVSDGQLGSSPGHGRLDAASVALVLVAAGFVRCVDVIETPAWALA